MKIVRFITAVALATALATAQDKPKLEATIIPVKTLSGDSFDRLVRLIGVFGVRMHADNKLRTILVYADKEQTAEVRRVIEALDKPGSEAAIGRNIEATLTFLRCSTKPPSDPKPLPADLEPVARQLRAITHYKDIQLWESIPLHLQEGRATEQSTKLPGQQASAIATAQIKLIPESVQRRETGRYVRFERISIGFRLPYSAAPDHHAFMDVGITTAGDFKEGQKSVLGKVSGIDEDTGIFVVVSLKVLD